MANRGQYVPTTWNSGAAPGISAAELQKIEDQIEALDVAWITNGELDVGTQLYLNATSGADIRPGGDVSPVLDGGGNLGSAALSWGGLYAEHILDENGVLVFSLALGPEGTVLVSKDLIPAVGGIRDLGSAASHWQGLYVENIQDENGSLAFSLSLVSGVVLVSKDLTPAVGGTVNLGQASSWWGTLHYQNLTQHSDERDKSYMAPVDVPIDALRDLAPIRFRRDGDDERVSLGFGAQTLDVWVADWLPAGDYSMVTEPTPDTDERWGMDGTQLLPAMVGWMQELLERVEALEAG
jgi:hypothetical protein